MTELSLASSIRKITVQENGVKKWPSLEKFSFKILRQYPLAFKIPDQDKVFKND